MANRYDEFVDEEIVLTCEIVKPKENGWILFLFVSWVKNHFFLHILHH